MTNYERQVIYMPETKLSEKVQKIAKEIESLTVIEMADLSKYLEDKFGVSAMPIATASAQPTTSADAAEAKEEKTTFTVILSASGDNKLGVIKPGRESLRNLGLME